MNLDNFVVPEDKLHNTPSREDGCPVDLEVNLRAAGCDQIQIAGQMLKLPQTAMSTAHVLFQRFFYIRSFIEFSLLSVAMACLFLASKVSENERLTMEVIHVFHYLKQENKKTSKYMQVKEKLSPERYSELEKTLHDREFDLLTDLGFCVYVNLPHELLFDFLAKLNLDKNREMVLSTWKYLNDSFRTSASVRYTPETVACASILLAARLLKVPLPQRPPWWAKFGANFDHMQAANAELMKLREGSRPCLKNLEKHLLTVKEEHSRKLSKTLTAQDSQLSALNKDTSKSVESNDSGEVCFSQDKGSTSSTMMMTSTMLFHCNKDSQYPSKADLSCPTVPINESLADHHTVPSDSSKILNSFILSHTKNSKSKKVRSVSTHCELFHEDSSLISSNVDNCDHLASSSILGKRKCCSSINSSQIPAQSHIKKRKKA